MILEKFLQIKDKIIGPKRFHAPQHMYQAEYYANMQNMQNSLHQMEQQESFRMAPKKPEIPQGSLTINKEGETTEIDGFVIFAKESEPTEDSFINEEEYAQEFYQKVPYQDDPYQEYFQQK